MCKFTLLLRGFLRKSASSPYTSGLHSRPSPGPRPCCRRSLPSSPRPVPGLVLPAQPLSAVPGPGATASVLDTPEAWAIWGPAAPPGLQRLIPTWLAGPVCPCASAGASHNWPCTGVTTVTSSLQSRCGGPCQPRQAPRGEAGLQSHPRLPALKAAVVGVLPRPRVRKASHPCCPPGAPREDRSSPGRRQAPLPRLLATMPPILYTLINFCLTDLLEEEKKKR